MSVRWTAILAAIPILLPACSSTEEQSSVSELTAPGGKTTSPTLNPVCAECGCDPHHELPVVTHYDAATKGYRYLAADKPEVFLPYDATKPYTKGACYPLYANGRVPDVDRYVGDTWSTISIDDAEATRVLSDMCKATATPFQLLRPDAIGTRVATAPGVVQVIHGIVIDGSLATVILPANWTRQGSFPIVANGYYDLNDNLFHQEGPELMKAIARSTSGGRTGAIGVLWNGGGSLAGRTLNPRALDQFAKVIDLVHKELGGDPQRILTFGVSRGAVTALEVASNPKKHPYRVSFVAAAVPPTRIGEHSQLTSATFPGLLEGVSWTTGFQDAWRTGWTYPSCAGKPQLTGSSSAEAHLYILTGTKDAAEADAHRSLISDEYVAGLKSAGTQVHLQVGSHDFIVPYAHQVEYGLKLIGNGVPVEGEVYLRSGHYQRNPIGRVWDALQAYIDPAAKGQEPKVNPGIKYFQVNRANKTLDELAIPDGVFPFTLEGPRFVTRGSRFPLVMVGASDTQWEVTLQGAAGPYVWTGTIGANMKSIQWVDVTQAQTLGDYSYGLRIKKPNTTTWKEISSTSTIDGSPAVITLVDSEPNVSGTDIRALAAAPKVDGFGQTNWGLSEY